MTHYYEGQDCGQTVSKKPAKLYMAYTLNNTQPVVCTLVNDEPLFYMLDDVSEDDDSLFDDSETEELRLEIQKLHTQINSHKNIAKNYQQDDTCLIHAITAEIEGRDKATDQQSVLEILSRSTLGQAFSQSLSDLGYTIVETDFVASICVDAEMQTIFLQKKTKAAAKLFQLMGMIRKISLEKNAISTDMMDYHPDYAVFINRAIEADHYASFIRLAWETRLAGDDILWRFVETTAMRDLGASFAREACTDFRTLNSGKAQATAFERWFLTDRSKEADSKLVQNILSRQTDYNKETIIDDVASIIMVIETLGRMPIGKNYLSSFTQILLNDTIFTEVRDRENANFLWFIKFERSFNEVEQQLQNSDQQSASDIKSGHSLEDTDHAPHRPDNTGTVVYLPFIEKGEATSI